jgi:DNA invertase Pin-like site-specific DNA recombinase
MDSEEVRRVAEALDAIEQIADLEQRVRAKSQVMAAQAERNKEWSQERDDLIRRLHDDEGLSYRKIAVRLDIKLSTVQAVFRGYKGSGTTRPKVQREASDG